MTKSLSAVISERVRHFRKLRRLTVKQLSDLCSAYAPSLSVAVITNIERPQDGVRAPRPVTVDELLALALALRVPPLAILTPVGVEPEMTIMPGLDSSPLDAWRWIVGEAALPGTADEQAIEYRDAAQPVWLMRQHESLVESIANVWQTGRYAAQNASPDGKASDDAMRDVARGNTYLIDNLDAVRKLMETAEMKPPVILSVDVAEALLYRDELRGAGFGEVGFRG